MYKAIAYQMANGKQWKWRLMFNQYTLARADKGYSSSKAALKAFAKVKFACTERVITAVVE